MKVKVMIAQKFSKLVKSNLVINSYLIMVTRAIGSVTGFIFWVLAARLILPGEIGLASSVIAASLLIANLAQLGYGYGLVRFLPNSSNPAELINLALETTTILCIALSLLFLSSLNIISPDLVIVRSYLFLMLGFIILSVTTSLGQILNWIFFARQKFTLSLIYITVQSLLAIGLLFILANRKSDFHAIIYAYTGASVICLILSTWFFLQRAEPGYRFFLVFPFLKRSQFTNYLLSSYLTDQALKGLNTLLPLLVLNVLGPVSNAYFYLTWAITSGLVSLIGGVSASLFSEGSNHPEKVNFYTLTSLKLGLIYSIVACLGVAVCSKLILGFYGKEYMSQANNLFLLLIIAVVPGVMISVLISFLRIQTKSSYLLLYAGLIISISMICLYAGMHIFGLIGIGYGWITAQITLVAIGLLLWKSLQMKNDRKVILTKLIE
jgi:O-antigen/teichoic acid export membrane protein